MAATRSPGGDLERSVTAELAGAVRRLAADAAALIAADARLAGVSLVAMINGLIFAGLCMLTGWGLLVAFVVWGLVASGLTPGPVLGALAVLHVVLGVVLWRRTARLARHLEFEATRRQLLRSDGDAGR